MPSEKRKGTIFVAGLLAFIGCMTFYYRSLVAAEGSVLPEPPKGYFAQMTDGGGYVTEVILANPGETELIVTLDLFRSNGSSLTLTINGVTNSRFTWTVMGRGALFLKTSGSGSQVATGWVHVRTNGPTGISIDYIYDHMVQGRMISEAASDTAVPTEEYSIMVDYHPCNYLS